MFLVLIPPYPVPYLHHSPRISLTLIFPISKPHLFSALPHPNPHLHLTYSLTRSLPQPLSLPLPANPSHTPTRTLNLDPPLYHSPNPTIFLLSPLLLALPQLHPPFPPPFLSTTLPLSSPNSTHIRTHFPPLILPMSLTPFSSPTNPRPSSYVNQCPFLVDLAFDLASRAAFMAVAFI